MKIRCYAAHKAKAPLKEFFYEPKPLGPWEVEIQISYCGICHSDIHLIDGDWGKDIYPLVPGHEVIGTVVKVGENVTHLKKAQRVGVGWQSGSCMQCEWCVKGEENLCHHDVATCVGRFGGFAERLITDSRFAFPIPDNLDSEKAAPLLCAGITVYSPLKRWITSPSLKVGVIGIGGLGHLALQFANRFGCEVTALSTSSFKKEDTKSLGAKHFVLLTNQRQMKDAFNSLDLILSTTPIHLNWEMIFKLLRPNGKLCIVGALPDDMKIPANPLIVEQKAVLGSVIGSRWMMEEMLIFAARHKIQAQTEVIPLAGVNEAIKKIRANKARFRKVLKVDS